MNFLKKLFVAEYGLSTVHTERTPSAISPARITIPELVSLRTQAGTLPLFPHGPVSYQAGSYRSVFKGRGMEFAESRPYQQGDDIRTLDWRLTARLGKPHTKVFQEERDRAMILWVDLHPSMFFASQGVFKAVQAARAAGLFAWRTAVHTDRLGGIIFDGKDRQELQPGLGDKAVLRFFRLLCDHPSWERNTAGRESGTNHLEKSRENRQSSMTEHLVRLRRVSRSGNQVVLFSDMRGISPTAEQQLGRLARDNQVILCFLYDALEKELPPSGWYQLSDGVRELSFHSGSASFRQHYAAHFQQRKQQLQSLCHRLGIHFCALSTRDDVQQVLQQSLVPLFRGAGQGRISKMHGSNRLRG
nr:DUF58 domain-containing protein [uncultured Desulfobulbus sp.]